MVAAEKAVYSKLVVVVVLCWCTHDLSGICIVFGLDANLYPGASCDVCQVKPPQALASELHGACSHVCAMHRRRVLHQCDRCSWARQSMLW